MKNFKYIKLKNYDIKIPVAKKSIADNIPTYFISVGEFQTKHYEIKFRQNKLYQKLFTI